MTKGMPELAIHSVIVVGGRWYRTSATEGHYLAVVWYGRELFYVHKVRDGSIDLQASETDVFTYGDDQGNPPELHQAIDKMVQHLARDP